MKLSVSRDAFLARLGVAARGVSTRSSIQTLSGVLIRIDEGAIVDRAVLGDLDRIELERREQRRR